LDVFEHIDGDQRPRRTLLDVEWNSRDHGFMSSAGDGVFRHGALLAGGARLGVEVYGTFDGLVKERT
jgi:hypothetical protein